ncbi:MAG: prepilin peptidase [Candidatus Aminicenantes bacterium]|nr:prepilin peptidase [Candidatus Aminicenantes bacterium]
METVIIILFGLAWGSFLNVVIFRLPRDLSIVTPPSSCPQCGRRIKFYENIPLLSYAILRGKCRGCKAKIPLSYPLVEALTPLCFLLIYGQYGINLHFIASCLFVSALIALGFIDYAHQILPDEITLPGIALAVVYSLFRADLSLMGALVGALVGAGILLLIFGLYYLLRKKEGLGMGDVTLMLMVGAFLGWKLSLLTLILGSFSGAIVGVFMLGFKKKGLQHALPFGTFLAPAAFIALLYGRQIISAYLSLYKTP